MDLTKKYPGIVLLDGKNQDSKKFTDTFWEEFEPLKGIIVPYWIDYIGDPDDPALRHYPDWEVGVGGFYPVDIETAFEDIMYFLVENAQLDEDKLFDELFQLVNE